MAKDFLSKMSHRQGLTHLAFDELWTPNGVGNPGGMNWRIGTMLPSDCVIGIDGGDLIKGI